MDKLINLLDLSEENEFDFNLIFYLSLMHGENGLTDFFKDIFTPKKFKKYEENKEKIEFSIFLKF